MIGGFSGAFVDSVQRGTISVRANMTDKDFRDF